MTEEEGAALDALDGAAAREDLKLAIDFQPGDVQLVSNSTVLHARTACEDHDHPPRRRHLLRLWWPMDEPGPFTDEAIVRFGPLRYGALGLTAAEVAEGSAA